MTVVGHIMPGRRPRPGPQAHGCVASDGRRDYGGWDDGEAGAGSNLLTGPASSQRPSSPSRGGDGGGRGEPGDVLGGQRRGRGMREGDRSPGASTGTSPGREARVPPGPQGRVVPFHEAVRGGLFHGSRGHTQSTAEPEPSRPHREQGAGLTAHRVTFRTAGARGQAVRVPRVPPRGRAQPWAAPQTFLGTWPPPAH